MEATNIAMHFLESIAVIIIFHEDRLRAKVISCWKRHAECKPKVVLGRKFTPSTALVCVKVLNVK